ncbi:hypothetical protein BH760_gp31 [Gordonia phage Splinter]|uniref:Uncharacterized protein n=2 Tax=Vendettavirus vendetta TaxID=2049886 RepID=A0A166Y4C4_9CAUD|nr:hypothetical protein BH795_gp31 [Gordonia phage Vendetta]YP_009275434.1 hypothetical protein BH760_gp31 [Gordonia phage Splinter]ANA85627.1 hypothetical protein PBI_VENDETTA_80 [Gordonia phage Vendetta]ANA85706.1 hypothetical protein PBI_SPLINTER_80 [Gordonia phage Splinter]
MLEEGHAGEVLPHTPAGRGRLPAGDETGSRTVAGASRAGATVTGVGAGVAEVLDTWSCGHCTWTVQAEGQSATVLSARWHLYRAHHVETNGADVADHGQHGTRERFTPKPKRNRRGKSKAEGTPR